MSGRAERRKRGQSYGGYDLREFSAEDGMARLNAQLDQIREEMGAFVDGYPHLNARPLYREDEPPAA